MNLSSDHIEITVRLLVALAAGGLIGLERSYHGRPAGFRTHGLVCLASSLLMLVSVYEAHWMAPIASDQVRMDPTRMSQGIMTGIGFLGAGVIMIQGFSVRGLTTAASIWITAAIGILIGIGFYFPALLAVILTLGTLSLFRWIETMIPAQFHAYFVLRLAREQAMSEEELRRLVAEHGFTIANLNYRLDAREDFFEYRMILRGKSALNGQKLTQTLNVMPAVIEFRISPTGD
jgi:putative Mg2+ transporter-C (MgtC) family protein